jgi:D-sedoheptulose 7-phosphate isomerase
MAFDFDAFWAGHRDTHINVAQVVFSTLQPTVTAWVDQAVICVKQGGKIMFCGNGGSAADAQHIAAELSVKLGPDRPPIAGLCLSLDPSAMTACGNDFGYDQIFARQVRALGHKGDMLVGLSTSGNSPNILQALMASREMGIATVGLTGETGGKLPDLCDILLKIPARDTARIQEMHITLGHIFCGALERRLGLIT